MTKYSIEVGHLLAKDPVGHQHRQALLIKKELNLLGYNCLMIDNYNFREQKYNLQDLTQIYQAEQETLDLLIYEQQLVDLAAKVLNQIPRSLIKFNDLGLATLKINEETYIDLVTPEGYACAWLTTVWYLARLNRLEWDLPKVSGLVNILPEQFRQSEKKVQKVMDCLFPQELNRIIWYFYDADSLAKDQY
jgi:hypothetical protein